MTRSSEIRLIDPVDETALDAVTSLPVFDDLRSETTALQPESIADGQVFQVGLRDHWQNRRPLLLVAVAAVLVLLAGLIVAVGANSALTHPVSTAWEPGQVFSPPPGHLTHRRAGTWRLLGAVLTGTWQQNSSGPPPGSLDCPAASVCYAMSGHYPNATAGAPLLGEFLYVSANVGATWTLFAMPSGFAPMSSLSCADAETCAAGGTYRGQPVLVTTGDGGHGFTIDPLPSGLGDAYVVSCPAAGVCDALVATRADSSGTPLDATLLTTTNGGASFTDRPIARGDSMSALDCSSELACTAVGTSDTDVNDWTSGVAAATSDGGATWTVNSLPAGFGVSYVSQLSCADATHCAVTGFVAGGSGTQNLVGDIATTSNGGRTWIPETMPSDVPEPQFSGLSCPTATECWAAGSEAIPEQIGNVSNGGSPMLLGTTNGGETWSKVTFSVPEGAPNYDSQSYLNIGLISCATADVCASLGAAAQGSPTTPVYSLVIPTSG